MNKINVLRKNHHFQEVINKKKQVVTKSIVLYHQKSNQEQIRIGISISKKFAIAAKRNKHRRQVRKIIDDLKIVEKYKWKDIVLIIRKPFMSMNNNLQIKAIKDAFERLINGK